MAEGTPSDYQSTIQDHKHESLAVLVSSDANCIEGVDKLAVRGREFEAEGPGLSFDPPPRVVVIVVLCPGDTIDDVMEWVEQNGIAPPERALFVYHPDCDLYDQLSPWYDLFDEDPIAYEMETYPGHRPGEDRTVAQRVGGWYNDWIYLDATGWDWPRQ